MRERKHKRYQVPFLLTPLTQWFFLQKTLLPFAWLTESLTSAGHARPSVCFSLILHSSAHSPALFFDTPLKSKKKPAKANINTKDKSTDLTRCSSEKNGWRGRGFCLYSQISASCTFSLQRSFSSLPRFIHFTHVRQRGGSA